jgi:hypothetical protein
MKSRRRNSNALVRFFAREGWTLMIVLGPSQRTRRVHVPRWALLGLCCAWLSVMLGAAWFGFNSAAPARAGAQDTQNGARVATGPVPTSRQ